MLKARRALISVSDKRGLIPFARGLAALRIEILSTGGTAKALREAGVPVVDVAERTGFPEIMAGRVKTLHPVVHGGLLGRRGVDDEVMQEHGIEPIDVLAVNLYPFQETIVQADVTDREAIEQIDIGGPAMIRAAAKNHDRVAVVVDPDDYDDLLAALQIEQLPLEYRRRLAAKAFAHTSGYDSAIATWLGTKSGERFPEYFLYAGRRLEVLRYGGQ
jgi:phosphoribosylaminoimidazolecarboxamide formyltransferase/IMP cyclohydrolase